MLKRTNPRHTNEHPIGRRSVGSRSEAGSNDFQEHTDADEKELHPKVNQSFSPPPDNSGIDKCAPPAAVSLVLLLQEDKVSF